MFHVVPFIVSSRSFFVSRAHTQIYSTYNDVLITIRDFFHSDSSYLFYYHWNAEVVAIRMFHKQIAPVSINYIAMSHLMHIFFWCISCRDCIVTRHLYSLLFYHALALTIRWARNSSRYGRNSSEVLYTSWKYWNVIWPMIRHDFGTYRANERARERQKKNNVIECSNEFRARFRAW